MKLTQTETEILKYHIEAKTLKNMLYNRTEVVDEPEPIPDNGRRVSRRAVSKNSHLLNSLLFFLFRKMNCAE